MSLEPNLAFIPEREKNPFLKDVEKTLKGNLYFGEHGFDLLRENKTIAPYAGVMKYKKGPKCTHLNGQYILVDIPGAAGNVFQEGVLPHDLKRLPVGLIVPVILGTNQTVYPFTAQKIGLCWNTDITNPAIWNTTHFSISTVRLSGYTGFARLIVVVF